MSALETEQQALRDAIDVLKLRGSPDETTEFLIDWFTTALADHDNPEIGCPAEPSRGCFAAATARRIVAGQA